MNPPSNHSTLPPGSFAGHTEVERHGLGEYVRYAIYRHNDSQQYAYKISLKVVGGIRAAHGCWQGDYRPVASELVSECSRHGVFSTRPYRLGQPQDSTTVICVWALYANYCDHARYTRTELLRQAYPNTRIEKHWTPQIWSAVLDQAEWEGLIVPIRWDVGSATQLARALHDLDARNLAKLLTSTYPTNPLECGHESPRAGTVGCP